MYRTCQSEVNTPVCSRLYWLPRIALGSAMPRSPSWALTKGACVLSLL